MAGSGSWTVGVAGAREDRRLLVRESRKGDATVEPFDSVYETDESRPGNAACDVARTCLNCNWSGLKSRLVKLL